ncbi:hypothetical protein DFS34DRAFT_184296 [Phlyctochytrium arcticum]|nr:hypothetical protein DFS34DRAFT_184296 [Phlyctochytrium arcticum]
MNAGNGQGLGPLWPPQGPSPRQGRQIDHTIPPPGPVLPANDELMVRKVAEDPEDIAFVRDYITWPEKFQRAYNAVRLRQLGSQSGQGTSGDGSGPPTLSAAVLKGIKKVCAERALSSICLDYVNPIPPVIKTLVEEGYESSRYLKQGKTGRETKAEIGLAYSSTKSGMRKRLVGHVGAVHKSELNAFSTHLFQRRTVDRVNYRHFRRAALLRDYRDRFPKVTGRRFWENITKELKRLHALPDKGVHDLDALVAADRAEYQEVPQHKDRFVAQNEDLSDGAGDDGDNGEDEESGSDDV